MIADQFRDDVRGARDRVRRAVPAAVRRRLRPAVADRPGRPVGDRHRDRRPAAGQEGAGAGDAVGRGAGADRGRAAVRDARGPARSRSASSTRSTPRSTRPTSAGSRRPSASLADRTQFIVITHNRGTIEAADALYGVTVGDDSVSRVISLRLDEAQALAGNAIRTRAGALAEGLLMFWRRRKDRRAGRAAATAPSPSEPRANGAEAAPHRPTTDRRDPSAGRSPNPRSARRTRRAAPAPCGAPASVRRRRRSTAAFDLGLARTRGAFVGRLRGVFRGDQTDWDEVEETLIAGDVGAALAMDLVEKARRQRDPRIPRRRSGASSQSLLVERDRDWTPQPSAERRPRGRARRRRERDRQDHDDRQARHPLQGRGPSRPAGRRRHVPGRRDRPAPHLGRSGRRCRSSPTRPAPIPAPSSTTRSTRRSPGARTSSSPTPPAASTPSPT